jgi:hypothetical protein
MTSKHLLEGVFTELLQEWDDRLPWSQTVGSLSATEILRGSDETDLVVVAATSPRAPTGGDLQGLWRARSKGGVAPVLVAVTYPLGSEELVALLGLTEDAVPVSALERTLAEQLIRDALRATSPSGLHAEMRRRLASLSGGVASGVRNEGLFASHVLELQPDQQAWSDLCAKSAPLVASRGEQLLEGLGFTVEPVPDGTVLRSTGEGHRRAAAVLLADGESFENPLSRFHNSNAVMHGLALAQREHLDWLVVLGGPVLRLYPVNPDVGVGRKGQTQTYVELDLSLLTAVRSGYLTLLFSPDSLSDNGTIARLLSESSRYATGLSERLRDRVYVDVIPTLAVAVADKMRVVDLPKDQQKDALGEAYHQAMIILFRLLFVAYAEDRRLLPYEASDQYTRNSLTRLALDLLERPGQDFDARSTTLWDDLTQVWKVIDTGDMDGWGVPAYNGGLFTRDADKNPSGAATYTLDLTNDQVGPVLSALLIDINQDEILGLVDFRSLSVREFGTIYEGLLESGLDVAETNLSLDKSETYVLAKAGDEIRVHAGQVYFHSRSGTRKATGSYFTKPFAVEHLLDSALEPAIDDHLARIKGLIDAGAAKSAGEALFDFRVTDLSMGSAHFLVAAIDRIEARFSAFLIQHPMPEVAVELHRLRTVSAMQMGLDPADSGVDDGQLLRRQLARRCIYGADINEIAVELSRLAVWIHTFVPGLPLSFLNHSLVWGNSLTGVGTIAEITEAFADAEVRELKKKPDASATLLDGVLGEFLDRAGEHLAALGALSDASVGDVAAAGKIQDDIEGSLAPLSALCDLITAERATRHLGTVQELATVYDRKGSNPKQVKSSSPHPDRVLLSASPALFTAATATALEAAILAHPDLERAREIASSVKATHMPVRFPEVFRRDRPGFDCVLGNPPWDEVMVEAPKFWRRYLPGLMGLKPAAQKKAIKSLRKQHPDAVPAYEAEVVEVARMRKVLLALPYPGLGTGDVDYYQVFSWRMWSLMRTNGRMGVVFPRSLLNSAGSAAWRDRVLTDGTFENVTLLSNTGRWVFAEVHPQYVFALLSLKKVAETNPVVRTCGPFHSAMEYFAGRGTLGELPAKGVRSWSTAAAFPSLPNTTSVEVFKVLRAHPRLDEVSSEWDFRPIAEFHATNDSKMFDAGPEAAGLWPVYTGASFNLWEHDTGEYFAWGDPQVMSTALSARRNNQIRTKSTVFYGMPESWAADPSTLPMINPRIAFRDIARATDTRTIIAALIPGKVPLVNTAPYLFRRAGDARSEAYLLGFLCSIPLDWFSRRFVEIHASLHIVKGFPIPRPVPGDALANRVIEIGGRLAAVDSRFADWATQVGVQVGSVTTDEEKDDLICELDALASLMYGLSEEQVTTVFETFHRGWVYGPRLGKVLLHYKAWASQLTETPGGRL